MTARQSRSVARLAAVQALYQMEVSSIGVEHVIREFTEHRFDRDVDGETLAAADENFFADLVRGVVSQQKTVDAAVVKRLGESLVAAIRTPEVRARLTGQGAEVVTMSPAEVDGFFASERERWAKVVQQEKLQLD